MRRALQCLGFIALVVVLSGCIIINTKPSTSIPVQMEVGQLKNFTVTATNILYPNSTLVYSWYVDGEQTSLQTISLPFLALPTHAGTTFPIVCRVDVKSTKASNYGSIIASEKRTWTVAVSSN